MRTFFLPTLTTHGPPAATQVFGSAPPTRGGGHAPSFDGFDETMANHLIGARDLTCDGSWPNQPS